MLNNFSPVPDPVAFTYSGSDGCLLRAVAITSKPSRDHDYPPVVMLHGGGPDHHSMYPLALALSGRHQIVLPDIRGYGLSVCREPSRHTWQQYTDDVISLLDYVGAPHAILVGAGIGTTIALRVALAHPSRVAANALISVEDIEDDDAKEEEKVFLKEFADRARDKGLEAAWEPVLSHFPPIIVNLVRDAIPRSDQLSIAAAAAIAFDRSFRDVAELAAIRMPTLVFPGMDARHPKALAVSVARIIPLGELSDVEITQDMQSAEDFAKVFGPPILRFIERV